MIKRWGLFVLGALCVTMMTVACGGSSSDGGADVSKPPPALQETVVMGQALDLLGFPLAGVTVTGGGATTTTDAQGNFKLKAPAGSDVIVSFSKAGFLPNQKKVDVQDGSATSLHVSLAWEHGAKKLDADKGGTVFTIFGASLTAGPGAFVDKNGNVVTGEVDVHLTTLDMSKRAQRQLVPNLRANDGGEMVELESYGLIDVTVRQNGEELQIKQGETVKITIPISSGITEKPQEIALWSFDTVNNTWIKEGTATLGGLGNGIYEADIPHLSLWNADQRMETTCITGVVKMNTGDLLPGAFIYADGLDHNGFSNVSADSNGRFCLPVRKDSKILVTAKHPDGSGHAKEIQSGSKLAPIPLTCSSCTDIGEFVIPLEGYTAPDGTTTKCEEVENPIPGSCADPLWELFKCLNPQGSCVQKLKGEVVWTNGARLVFTNIQTAQSGDKLDLEFISPEGKKCGSARAVNQDSEAMLYTVDGKDYTVTYNEGSTKVICPNQETLTLTAEVSAALNACTGGLDQGCKSEEPQLCTTQSDCNNVDPSFNCCAVTEAVKYCLPTWICSQIP